MDKFEIDVEIASCVFEKFNALAVDKRSHDVEIPLAVKNPTELIPSCKVLTLDEIFEPTFVLRFDRLVVV